jgi:hypothetical protein
MCIYVCVCLCECVWVWCGIYVCACWYGVYDVVYMCVRVGVVCVCVLVVSAHVCFCDSFVTERLVYPAIKKKRLVNYSIDMCNMAVFYKYVVATNVSEKP